MQLTVLPSLPPFKINKSFFDSSILGCICPSAILCILTHLSHFIHKFSNELGLYSCLLLHLGLPFLLSLQIGHESYLPCSSSISWASYIALLHFLVHLILSPRLSYLYFLLCIFILHEPFCRLSSPRLDVHGEVIMLQ